MNNSSGIFIIIDRDTHGIICSTDDMFLARSVTSGIPSGDSTKVIGKWGIWNSLINDAKYNRTFDFNDIRLHYQLVSREGVVVTLNEDLVTPEWIEKRKKIILRLKWIKNFQDLVHSATIKASEYFGLYNFEGFLVSQLNQSNPATGYFTPAIREWAEIQDVSEFDAWQELTIRSNHYGLVYMRNHAIYLKYLRKINQLETADEYLKCCDLAWDELTRGAYI
jgi:hypothetical protein